MAKNYIKLKLDYFNSLSIRKLKRILGNTQLIIYLKLQLLSLENEGFIYYEGVESNIYDEIAIALDEDIDYIEDTLDYLTDKGLAQFIDKDTLRIFKVQDIRNRQTKKYKNWREKVFKRDNYTCKKCGKRGVEIQAHHVKPWALYPALRYEVNNGITLCNECHKEIHKKETL